MKKKEYVLSIPYIFYRKKLRIKKKLYFFDYRSDLDLHFLEVDSVPDQNEVDPQHCTHILDN